MAGYLKLVKITCQDWSSLAETMSSTILKDSATRRSYPNCAALSSSSILMALSSARLVFTMESESSWARFIAVSPGGELNFSITRFSIQRISGFYPQVV